VLSLDLHPIFCNNRDIELALRQFLFTAARSGESVADIIPGKGSGQLKKRVLAFLEPEAHHEAVRAPGDRFG
jgi:DNA-nicking Smr family endonuclease